MLELQSTLSLIISVALFATKAFALVDCLTRSPARFAVVDTLPKNTWLVILVLAVLTHVLFWEPLSLLNLIGTVAALVYLAQVRSGS